VSSTILNITFDCADPRALATFWGQLTGWPVITEPQPGYTDCVVGRRDLASTCERGGVPERHGPVARPRWAGGAAWGRLACWPAAT
jgi:hypothetical protein